MKSGAGDRTGRHVVCVAEPAALWVERVERKKAARVVALTVALAGGGIAALLAGRSQRPTEVKQTEAPKVETVDVLVAKSNIPIGNTISPQDVQWRAWPTSASTGNFIRKANRPDAIKKLSGMIMRVPFVASEPIREQKLVDARGSNYGRNIVPLGVSTASMVKWMSRIEGTWRQVL